MRREGFKTRGKEKREGDKLFGKTGDKRKY